MAEAEARPKALALAAQFVELTRKAVNSWPQVKPWLEKVDIDALTAQVSRTLCGLVRVLGRLVGRSACGRPLWPNAQDRDAPAVRDASADMVYSTRAGQPCLYGCVREREV